MKKCAIVYKNRTSGKEFWAKSVDENGATYCLVLKNSDIPSDHHCASEFYGKNRLKRAQERIERDIKLRRFPGYEGRIIEYDDEPEWYFEIWYVLKHAYGDSDMQEVRKGFPLDPDIDYRLFNGHKRPLIHDLELDELQRYYKWRKLHYKGKIKEDI